MLHRFIFMQHHALQRVISFRKAENDYFGTRSLKRAKSWRDKLPKILASASQVAEVGEEGGVAHPVASFMRPGPRPVTADRQPRSQKLRKIADGGASFASIFTFVYCGFLLGLIYSSVPLCVRSPNASRSWQPSGCGHSATTAQKSAENCDPACSLGPATGAHSCS